MAIPTLTKSKERLVALPSDFQRAIPPTPYEWLKKYNLTLGEIWENNIGWSESMQLLIFPVFNELGEVVLWQGRNFRLGASRKYLTFGAVKDHLHILKLPTWEDEKRYKYVYHSMYLENQTAGLRLPKSERDFKESTTVVICEDIMSAIKINRIENSMPLFGSYISNQLLSRLSKLFSHSIVWSDPDKQGKEYVSIINRGQMYFDSVRCIISEKDPKDYETNKIKECLSA